MTAQAKPYASVTFDATLVREWGEHGWYQLFFGERGGPAPALVLDIGCKGACWMPVGDDGSTANERMVEMCPEAFEAVTGIVLPENCPHPLPLTLTFSYPPQGV